MVHTAHWLKAATYRDNRGEFSGISASGEALECHALVSHGRLPSVEINIGYRITFVTPSGVQMHAYNHRNYWLAPDDCDLADGEPFESARVRFETTVRLQPGSIVSPSVYSHHHGRLDLAPLSLSLSHCVPMVDPWQS